VIHEENNRRPGTLADRSRPALRGPPSPLPATARFFSTIATLKGVSHTVIATGAEKVRTQSPVETRFCISAMGFSYGLW